jgi:hypothetical protein
MRKIWRWKKTHAVARHVTREMSFSGRDAYTLIWLSLAREQPLLFIDEEGLWGKERRLLG